MNTSKNGTKPKKPQTRTVSIALNKEDEACVTKLQHKFGLIKTTDCIRLALRQATRQLDRQQA